jgi:hypothetical protein
MPDTVEATSHFPIPLGLVVITQCVKGAVGDSEIAEALARHKWGDWGEVSKTDEWANADALENSSRLVSVYRDRNGKRFFVITEADRRMTTVLLPAEY